MKPKLRSYESKLPSRFEVVRTKIPIFADNYRVYRVDSSNSRSLMAMFRYKLHAEHFSDYLNMRFQ